MKASVFVAATLLYAVAAFAQTGTISGKIVTVSGGNPVPKATVRVKNTATDASFSTQSEVNGNYTIGGLPPGAYELATEFPMFLPFRQKDIPVQAGQTARVEIQLSDMQLNTLGDGGDDFVKLVSERPAPVGPTPRMPDGKPDLNGVWLAAIYRVDGDPPEPLPWAEELSKKRRDRLGIDSPGAHCLPNGLASSGNLRPYRFVQTKDIVVVVEEANDPTRQIYLDGRSHPEDPNPTYVGHSVGHWEGETLVVDTVGLTDRGWIAFGSFPQTEKLHITERFRRPDLGHLEREVTFDDPSTFKKPWKLKRVSALAPQDIEVLEYVCAENNKDVEHYVGK
jgi:carboxypeptidase family protein